MRIPSRVRSAVALFFVVSALGAASAHAQCAFDRPGSSSKAAKISMSLIPSFAECFIDYNSGPYAYGLANRPACAPPVRAGEASGNLGWRFAPAGSFGRIEMKRVAAGPNLAGYAPVLRDIGVKIVLRGITEGDRVTPANGTAKLVLTVRPTIDDYSGYDMTVKDFTIEVAFPVAAGAASFSGTLGQAELPLGQPLFPDCTNLVIIDVRVKGRDNLTFAAAGVSL